MAYFADFTPYTYGYGYGMIGKLPALNIGWLSAAYPYPTGEPDDRILDDIIGLNVYNLYRGSHICDLGCDVKIIGNKRPPGISGNGEFRVMGTDGIVYAAPVLVHHYIKVHQYAPPQEFIDAVRNVKGNHGTS